MLEALRAGGSELHDHFDGHGAGSAPDVLQHTAFAQSPSTFGTKIGTDPFQRSLYAVCPPRSEAIISLTPTEPSFE